MTAEVDGWRQGINPGGPNEAAARRTCIAYKASSRAAPIVAASSRFHPTRSPVIATCTRRWCLMSHYWRDGSEAPALRYSCGCHTMPPTHDERPEHDRPDVLRHIRKRLIPRPIGSSLAMPRVFKPR